MAFLKSFFDGECPSPILLIKYSFTTWPGWISVPNMVDATSATFFFCSKSEVASPDTIVADVPMQAISFDAADLILRMRMEISEPCLPR